MMKNKVNVRSPVRILEQSIRDGLGNGNLGVILASAGVGKSACLVQLGLDDLLHDRAVLHIAVGQTVQHLSAAYDTLLAGFSNLMDPVGLPHLRETIWRRRLIMTFGDSVLLPREIERVLWDFEAHLHLAPSTILVDGYDWNRKGCTAALQALKTTARRVSAELWMTARSPPGYDVRPPQPITPACEGCAALIDMGFLIEPQGRKFKLRLVKSFEDAFPPDLHLSLHGDMLRLVQDDALGQSIAASAG